ncbi:MAG: hypothetical protein KJ645_00655 [Planctomycetes bacterium]|nr:hypothetical protein [Planctomycetota bacterium]
MGEDYLSFERVLRELQIEEEELKRLVSAGEIKAYREADKVMQFKPEDVEKLKGSRSSDADVIELLDAEDLESDGEPTLDIGSTETAEELSFDEVDFGGDLGDDDLGLDSSTDDEVTVGAVEAAADEEDVDLGSLELEEEALDGYDTGSGSPSTRIRKSKIAGIAEEEEVLEPQWVVGLMAFSALVLLIGIFVMMDIASSTPSALVGWLVGMFS